MSVEFNHTIVRSTDKKVSATFLADILGVPVEQPWGPFLPITLGNGVTLDYLDVDDDPIPSQHYSFLVSDEVFDAAFARIQEANLPYWSEPHNQGAGQINRYYGGRGVYFEDPDGHYMELQTVPYGEVPEG
jgi:catechol 2,3-dioxygenase-like lactoylglutathione lyase family enzyme